jgi:xanthine dehydrogenase accessory factor
MTPVDLFLEAARLGETGVEAALATVVATSGSVPRHAGAKMLVHADGSIVGTIGGGKVELETIEAGREIARGAPPRLLTRHLVRDLAMCCGGTMEVWVEPLDAARWKALDEARRRMGRRQTSVLVTAIDVPGGKDVLADDECLRTRRARRVDGRFLEPILPPDRLVLFGGGHVARATAPLAAAVGFEVIVCDDEETLASAARFPDATLIHSFDVREVARELQPFGPGDYAVVLTRDHALDQELVEALIARDDLSYLGLIGSVGKVSRFEKRLLAKGVIDAARWARLHAPVGLDIGAETPEEIAISIVGELVKKRGARRTTQAEMGGQP